MVDEKNHGFRPTIFRRRPTHWMIKCWACLVRNIPAWCCSPIQAKWNKSSEAHCPIGDCAQLLGSVLCLGCHISLLDSELGSLFGNNFECFDRKTWSKGSNGPIFHPYSQGLPIKNGSSVPSARAGPPPSVGS